MALDATLNDDLRNEGYAREMVNRLQNLRKSLDFDVTDHIKISLKESQEVHPIVSGFRKYICEETLADELTVSESLPSSSHKLDLDGVVTEVVVEKV